MKNFQGYHAPRVLVVVDEACGVHHSIWQAIDGITMSVDELAEGMEKNVELMFKLGEETEEAVDYLVEEKSKKSRILRPRVFRPWPEEELLEELKKLDKLLILDRSVSFGSGGQLANEVMATLYRHNVKLEVHPVIVGLGGKDVNHKDIAKMVEEL